MAEPTHPLISRFDRPAVAAFVIVVAALFAYQNSFDGALTLDDFEAIQENATIRQLWPPGLALSPPPEAGVGGRPMANVSLAVNYRLSGTKVWSYHALNLLIHAAVALTLLGIVRRTLARPGMREQVGNQADRLALAVAVGWALHPLGTAAVDYLSQRTELLMSLCYVATLYSFIRGATGGGGRWYAGAVVASAVGMASKEVMVTAPFALVWYDRTFMAGSWRQVWRERGRQHLAVMATWLVLAYLMVTAPLAARGVGLGRGISSWHYALTESRAVIVYLQKACWPYPLVFDHGWPFLTPSQAWPYALGVVGLVAIAAVGCWRWPRAGFSGGWFLLLLAPTSTVVPILQQPVAESRTYLALAGLIALGLIAAWRMAGTRLWFGLGAGAVAFGLITLARNTDYADEVTLWSDTIVKNPQNARAHINLAAALARQGRIDEAAVHAGAAVTLQPGSHFARTNLGAALFQGGLVREALPHFEAAVQAQPGWAIGHLNLADALVRLGRRPEAIAHYARALAIEPGLAKAERNFSLALRLEDRTDEAIRHARAAVRLEPKNPEAQYNLGSILLQAGRAAEAVPNFEAALRLRPKFPAASQELAAAQKQVR